MTTPTTQPDDRCEQIAREIAHREISEWYLTADIDNGYISKKSGLDLEKRLTDTFASALQAAKQQGREEGKRPKLCQVCGDPILDVHICSGAEKFPEVAEMAGGDTGACFGPSAMGVSESSQAPDPQQQPNSKDEVLLQLRQKVAPRIKALKESERNVFEQPKSEPSQECMEIAINWLALNRWKEGCIEEIDTDQLRDAFVAALQAKQDELNALREEVLGVLEPLANMGISIKPTDHALDYVPCQPLTMWIRAAKALRDKLKASQPTLPQPQTPHQ